MATQRQRDVPETKRQGEERRAKAGLVCVCVCGEGEECKNGRWIKGGQRIGVGEGKTATASEWRKSFKRKDDLEGNSFGEQITHRSLQSYIWDVGDDSFTYPVQ